MRNMKILFLSAEVGPFVSVGGLSQVCYFLPRALAKQGDEVAIFTPKFGLMDKVVPGRKKWELKSEIKGMKVPLGEVNTASDLVCNVKSYQQSGKEVKTYFLENREYYELRANVYGYNDDHTRFMLLSKGCLEWLLIQKEKKGWFPDFIHCNDWHTGYFVDLARRNPRYLEVMNKVTIGLTVHNFMHQGNFDFRYCEPKDKDNGEAMLLPLLDEKLNRQNALLRAIKYSDAITTVSPSHAIEVLSSEYGAGLEKELQIGRDKLSGILNGLDMKEFDPATDPFIAKHFSKKNFEKARAKNKSVLQKEFGLPIEPKAFLVAYSGRLAEQKGVTLLIEAMTHLLAEYPKVQLIVMGGGEDSYREVMNNLAKEYPKQVGLHLLSNFQLPRKIFAGADAILLPSLFEPGGIVALEALRYGTVPIVRRTGGLNDVIEDFNPNTNKGNGFSFTNKDAWSLYGAVVMAMNTFNHEELWGKLVANCLSQDFSWEKAAKKYKAWYVRTSEARKRIQSAKNFVRMER
jgi:starch synthase